MIEVDDPRRNDVRRLLEQHRMFASGVMPPDGVHVLDPDEDALDADITFFSLRSTASCSASVRSTSRLGSCRAEIGARRRGYERARRRARPGRPLVAVAAARGVRRVSLERGAGEAFVPARSLYAAAGFVPCGPFGEYRATEDDVFMTRFLG
ncbi:MAG: GNAT family N-acetyltransferase [Gaiellaceae bacterium]